MLSTAGDETVAECRADTGEHVSDLQEYLGTSRSQEWSILRGRCVAIVNLCPLPKSRRTVSYYTSLVKLRRNTQNSTMSTPLARAATLTLMLVAVLAQGPTQTTTDGRMSVTSSATSVAPTASIASSTSYVATQTSASEVRVHVVKAGAGGFHFEPAELTNVSVGDVVTFEFYPPDHSVARAEYGSACVPYEYTGRDRTGFWSETQWVKTPRDVSSPRQFRQCKAVG